MSLQCCDCRSNITRRHKNGRPPKRCDPCKKKKACVQAKSWAAANAEKIASRNRGRRYSQCSDCGLDIDCSGKRGPLAKRCVTCHARHEKQSRRTSATKKKHCHSCKHCGVTFSCPRKRQYYCSTECMHLAQRKRITLVCKNNHCIKTFETTPRLLAKGSAYCSRKCAEARYPQPLVCQNPKCGREFRMKHVTKNPWQNKGKYCCPECYRDHRWGDHRPRRKSSRKARRSAGDASIATSLRKRCKNFGVTFDPACTREAVLKRDKWVCQKCRILCNKEYLMDAETKSIDWRNAEHDHIIAVSTKGSPGNVFENSQCLCRRCNLAKSNKSEGQLRLCLEEEAWGKGVRVRRQQNLKSCVGIQATGQSTKASLSLPLTAL
jgi:hypothetical protein